MPSKSKAQHNLMAAVANNPKFAKKTGIPQTVGADYMKADKKVKKYMKGGMSEPDMKVGGATRRTKVQEMNGMKAGGLAMVEKGGEKVPFYAADGVGKMNMGGKVMKYKAGGCVGDGMAIRGRTKGRMV
tara:strand:- start:612 stop:998 length:387 start_codon:yes stop_codon:yes gene_type:complete